MEISEETAKITAGKIILLNRVWRKMNHKKEKPEMWLNLFLLFFLAAVISGGILCKHYIVGQTANARFDSLQADVNDDMDTGIKDMGEVYAQENIQEVKENGTNNEIQNADIANIIKGEVPNTGTENGTAEEIQSTDAESGAGNDTKDGIRAQTIGTAEGSGIKVPEKDLDWNALSEQNKDIYAWIYVPGTTVDYPILQHPTDNSYYLNYNMDGTKGFPGCIYTEDYNNKDFSDIHTVIYGHNLKDKTMFTSLHNFENKELFSKDHYIYIYTQDYVFVYRIFAAYEFSAIHLLDNYDYANEYVYADYLKQIYGTTDRVANVREDIKVTTEDKIVTLSTCTKDSDSSKRFLVTGVLMNPKE